MEAAPASSSAIPPGGAVALEIARQGLLDLDRIVVINGALEDFRGPAGVVFPIMARMMAMNPLTGLFLSRGSSAAQVREPDRCHGKQPGCRRPRALRTADRAARHMWTGRSP
jgi:hypothetical protein